MKNWLVPFNDLSLGIQSQRQELDEAFKTVLDSCNFILGPQVEKFEHKLAEFTGRWSAVGVANGTDAIELALRAAVINHLETFVNKPTHVLTVANSAPATVAAIFRAGLKPRYVDVDACGQMSPLALELADWTGVVAVVPVHLHGFYPVMGMISRIAARKDVPVIEDAAQAIDSKHIGQGTMVCTSFYPTKNLGALGDGGAILTDSEYYNKLLRAMRFYGISESNRPSLRQTFVGVNSRLDEMQAAFLSVRLKHMSELREKRESAAQYYYQELPQSVLDSRFDQRKEGTFHILGVRMQQRDWARSEFAKRGIQTAIHYPIPAYNQMGSWEPLELPMTEDFYKTTLSLPFFDGITREQQDLVIDAMWELI